MNAERLLEKAGFSLLSTQPFWATIHYQLERGRVPVGPEVCPIMATDGKALYYNPEAVAKMPFGQIKTALAHEAIHCANAHHVRMQGRDLELSNIAADHVVNNILLDDGFEAIPGWVCDQRFKGWTFEKVYAALEKERQQQPKGDGGNQPSQSKQSAKENQTPSQQQSGKGQGQPRQAAKTTGGFGQIMPCPIGEETKQEAQWQIAVETAATAAKAAGKLPGHLQRLIDELREPKVDWRSILKSFIADHIPSDFTWSRPSRRTIGEDIYLPSRTKEGLADLVFAIDNSGSCAAAIAPFTSEVRTVHEDLKPSKLTVLCFDTRVHLLGEFYPSDDIEFRMRGGGGTDFRPVFQAVYEMDRPPRALVILTDLIGPLPKEAPDYPVLFVCTSRKISPWGETVRMDI